MEHRLNQLRKHLSRENLDGFILFSQENDNRPSIQYLSGFTGSFAILVITPDRSLVITDSRYFIQAEEQSPFELVKIADRDPWPHVKETLAECGIRRLGFESDRLTVDKLRILESFGPELTGYGKLMQTFRAVKDEQELDLLRTAGRIASEAFDRFYPTIQPGMTEAQLAAELVHEMRLLGAEMPVKGHFVVASGLRGARPHGVFTDKKIEDGDFITLDFGAVYQGYVSDITRTVGVGRVNPKLAAIYEIVLEAQLKTLEAASAKLTGAELDAVARNHIEAAGYGQYFTHGTGHGIGLEIHEMPAASRHNPSNLPENSVVTIEPGVYIPGLGGVRIEDDIIVLADGCEVITSARKDLIIL